ncbi:MAG: hypothetical protein DRH32_10080 [Deltaproteobacteria bacterium]|nr:MAG: hypothetical protein DRH32_10080 [Deltaproteobacteria bacterium]
MTSSLYFSRLVEQNLKKYKYVQKKGMCQDNIDIIYRQKIAGLGIGAHGHPEHMQFYPLISAFLKFISLQSFFFGVSTTIDYFIGIKITVNNFSAI